MNLDLLIYRDMSDSVNASLPEIGQDANEWFGTPGFEGLHVVAVGPPIHGTAKDATVVLAHGSRPMGEIQALIQRPNA